MQKSGQNVEKLIKKSRFLASKKCEFYDIYRLIRIKSNFNTKVVGKHRKMSDFLCKKNDHLSTFFTLFCTFYVSSIFLTKGPC